MHFVAWQQVKFSLCMFLKLRHFRALFTNLIFVFDLLLGREKGQDMIGEAGGDGDARACEMESQMAANVCCRLFIV